MFVLFYYSVIGLFETLHNLRIFCFYNFVDINTLLTRVLVPDILC